MKDQGSSGSKIEHEASEKSNNHENGNQDRDSRNLYQRQPQQLIQTTLTA